MRTNVSVGVQYIKAWLRGFGAVPIFNLMEDAATAEIARAQVWQWIHHPKGVLDDGRKITEELFLQIIEEECAKVKATYGEERYEQGKFALAKELFTNMTTSEEFVEFLTLPGYRYIA